MLKIKSGAIAASLAALIGLTSVMPAEAQNWSQRDRVIVTYCDRNPRDPDCNDFRRGRWDNDDYRRFYSNRRSNLDSIASGIFGFTFGAIVGSALANQNNNRLPAYRGGDYQSHVEACYDRYRSYDEETDTFLGYDGVRHRCNL